MKRLLILLALPIFILALARPALAQTTNQYSWSGSFTRPGTTITLSAGPFTTQSACYASVSSTIDQYQQTDNVTITGPNQNYCTCDTPIAQQGTQCPGYSGAATQAASCYGDSNNCPADQICGNANTCIAGNLANGASCTQDEQCQSSLGCVSGICGGSAAASAAPAVTSAPTTGTGFVPLAPIPGLTQGTTATQTGLATFLNNLYKYLIGLAAILAVIQIIRGGLEIATQDNVSKHADGRKHIEQALMGLVLVLAPALVFSIINPSILNLSVNLPALNTPAGTANVTMLPPGDACISGSGTPGTVESDGITCDTTNPPVVGVTPCVPYAGATGVWVAGKCNAVVGGPSTTTINFAPGRGTSSSVQNSATQATSESTVQSCTQQMACPAGYTSQPTGKGSGCYACAPS